MKIPKVSVIIGAYNCGEFIKKTVYSVIKQTFEDWELIVVDDCSKDDTCKKVESIKDKRIRIIKLDDNSGRPAVPRNKGIEASRGEFVTFLDHDDIWPSNKLELQLSAFYKHPEVGLVYGKVICFDDKTHTNHFFPKRGYSGNIFKKLLKGNFIGCSTVMVNRNVFEKVGLFNENMELIAVEDYELWLRIAYYYKAIFINKPLLMYRIYPKSLWAKKTNLVLAERIITALRSVFHILNISEKQKKYSLGHHYAAMGRIYLRLGQYDKFKEYTKLSLNMYFTWGGAIAIFFRFIPQFFKLFIEIS